MGSIMRRAPVHLLLAAALLGVAACSNGTIDEPALDGGPTDGRPADLARSTGDGANDAALLDASGAADLAVPCPKCPMGQRCVPMGAAATCVDPCSVVSCTPPAMCFVYDINGAPLMMDAYGPVGTCLDPCANVMCAANQSCVPSAHGVPLGACVDRCDCRNCGNCDANGTFVGMQAFCGNPNGSPATMACTVPCSGGQGCIPWDANGGICWPLEGCFSL
jgi:hypothetical protein